jgi:hypothetical protein
MAVEKIFSWNFSNKIRSQVIEVSLKLLLWFLFQHPRSITQGLITQGSIAQAMA